METLDSVASFVTSEHLHNPKERKHPSMTFCYNTYFCSDSVPNYLFSFNVSGGSPRINNPALGDVMEDNSLSLPNTMLHNIKNIQDYYLK